MNDFYGNPLAVGDAVILRGTVENIVSARELLVRPDVGQPFYVTGDSVVKVVVVVPDVVPDVAAQPPLAEETPAAPVVEVPDFIPDETPVAEPAPVEAPAAPPEPPPAPPAAE